MIIYIFVHARRSGKDTEKGHKKAADTFNVITDLTVFSNAWLLYDGWSFYEVRELILVSFSEKIVHL